MAVSGDGSRLYVADPSSGGVAVIDPGTQRVLNSVTRNLRSLRQGVSAAVSSDGTLYLAGTKRILAFDGDSLRLLRTLPLRRPVSAIATGTDASKLYVAVKNGVDTLDATTGRRLERI
jgi:YVTN family beta-propeller protein